MDSIKYTSCQEVIAMFVDDTNTQNDSLVDKLVQWIGQCLERMETTMMLEEDFANVTVKGYKGELPCNIYAIDAVKRDGRGLRYATKVGAKVVPSDTSRTSISTSSFPMDETYSVQGPWIILSVESAELVVYYYKFAVDEDGYPLVPDHILAKEACIHYIVYKMKYAEWLAGRLLYSEMKAVENDANHMMDRARSVMSFPSVNKMQSVVNRWMRLTPRVLDHTNLFNESNLPESGT